MEASLKGVKERRKDVLFAAFFFIVVSDTSLLDEGVQNSFPYLKTSDGFSCHNPCPLA